MHHHIVCIASTQNSKVQVIVVDMSYVRLCDDDFSGLVARNELVMVVKVVGFVMKSWGYTLLIFEVLRQFV